MGALVATAGGGVLVGTVDNASARSQSQNEAAVALDPGDPSRIVVTANDESTPSAGIFVGRSGDGGATWTRATVATGAGGDGFPVACCDATLAWDEYGNLFLAYLSKVDPPATDKIVLLLSTNAGASWTLLSTLAAALSVGSDPGVDRTSVDVGAGTVWVAWWAYNANDSRTFARGATVTGLGAVGAFSTPQALPQANTTYPDLAVGPSGAVAVVTQGGGGEGPSELSVNVDPDGLGAAPFGAATVFATNVGDNDTIPAQPNRKIGASGDIAYDRSNGRFRGRLYLVYSEEPVNESNDVDVELRVSTDEGGTWSSPRRVNDDSSGKSQFWPKVAVDHSSGDLAVSWYDARNDSANTKTEFWAGFSATGGASFEPNVRVSAGQSNATTVGGNTVDYGDYTGLDFARGVAQPAWADNSNSTGNNPDAATRFDIYTVAVRADFIPPALTLPGATTAEATGPSGAVVTFAATATDLSGASVPSCSPGSGSTFALAATTVTCSSSDPFANTTTGTFTVTVRDTTPPALTNTPADITAEATGPGGAAITYTSPTANDLVDGGRPVSCGPASGSTFRLGQTVVTCSAADTRGNSAAARFTVTIRDTTPPVLSPAPAVPPTEATGPQGAAVAFAIPTANDAVGGPLFVGCSKTPGSIFPIGQTDVTCEATDPSGNKAQLSFAVTVRDTSPPVILHADPATAEATGRSGAVVRFASPTASDIVDASRPVQCTPAAGSTFPLGATTVVCTASDSRGNIATARFVVTVRDTRPPVLRLPKSVTVAASSARGAHVHLRVSALDLVDGRLPVACKPSLGRTFRPGDTRVTCTARDRAGNVARGRLTVHVRLRA